MYLPLRTLSLNEGVGARVERDLCSRPRDPAIGYRDRQPVIACPFLPAVSTDSFSEHNDPASDYQIDQGGTERGSSEMHPYLISTAHLWFVLSDN